jgi:cytoskeletal protein CcmA (bactofilin family)
MKNILAILAFLVVASAPNTTLASAVVRSGDAVSIAQNQSVEGNFYGVGSAVALSGTVTGDAIVIGGTVTANGAVSEDLLMIGGAVNMSASGTKDVRIVGGDVTISKPIAGDLVVVAGRVTILSTASIKGDVLLYSEDATIDGQVGGQILGNVRNLRLNSVVAGGVDVTTVALTLGDQANITGDVQYASQNEVKRSPNAVVTGTLMKGATSATATNDYAALAREVATLFFISLFATLTLYLVARRFVEDMSRLTLRKFGFKTLIGFSTFAIAPISIGILFVSMLGILVGVIELALFVVLAIVSFVLVNAVFGAMIAKYVFKKNQLTVPYIIAGAVVTQLCLLVPFIGPVVLTFTFLATAGALVTSFYYRIISRGQ